MRHSDRTVLLAAAVFWFAGAGAATAQQLPRVENFRITSIGETTRIVVETSGDVRFREEFQPLPPNLTLELMGAVPDINITAYKRNYPGDERQVSIIPANANDVRIENHPILPAWNYTLRPSENRN